MKPSYSNVSGDLSTIQGSLIQKKKIKFTCVKDIREVLEIALEEKIEPKKA